MVSGLAEEWEQYAIVEERLTGEGGERRLRMKGQRPRNEFLNLRGSERSKSQRRDD